MGQPVTHLRVDVAADLGPGKIAADPRQDEDPAIHVQLGRCVHRQAQRAAWQNDAAGNQPGLQILRFHRQVA